MPKELVFAVGIEVLLVFSTLLLLSPPRSLGAQSPRLKSALTAGGMLMLCLTFCWSVILGCLLALKQFTLEI